MAAPKIPKLGDFAPNVLNKFKNIFDSIAGPASSEAIEEALAKETDPLKKQLLEIQLLIAEANSAQVLLANLLGSVKSKYDDLYKKLTEPPAPTQGQTTAGQTATPQAPPAAAPPQAAAAAPTLPQTPPPVTPDPTSKPGE